MKSSAGSQAAPQPAVEDSSEQSANSRSFADLRRVSSDAIGREGPNCTIRQRIANAGDKPASRLVVEISFHDALGKLAGRKAEAAVNSLLPAGAQEEFTFRVPCPPSYAAAQLRLPTSHGAADEPILAFATSVDPNAPPLSESLTQIAVEVPDRHICRWPHPCQLAVHFDGGRTASYEFRRDPVDHNVLVAGDSLLTAHFRKHGTARLVIQKRNGLALIPMTDANLRQPMVNEKPASLGSFIAGMFGKGKAGQ